MRDLQKHLGPASASQGLKGSFGMKSTKCLLPTWFLRFPGVLGRKTPQCWKNIQVLSMAEERFGEGFSGLPRNHGDLTHHIEFIQLII